MMMMMNNSCSIDSCNEKHHKFIHREVSTTTSAQNKSASKNVAAKTAAYCEIDVI